MYGSHGDQHKSAAQYQAQTKFLPRCLEVELPYHDEREDRDGQVADHITCPVKDVRGYTVDAVPRGFRPPFLLDGVATQEFGDQVAEQVTDTEKEESVRGPSEASAHAEELQILEDQRAFKSAQSQYVE